MNPLYRHPWRCRSTKAEAARRQRSEAQWVLEMQLEDERWRPNCTCPWHPDPLDPYYQCPDCERRQEEANRAEDATSPASADTLPKGRDVKQARCASKGSAVAAGETPKPRQEQPS